MYCLADAHADSMFSGFPGGRNIVASVHLFIAH
jgi:hypothetical protein